MSLLLLVWCHCLSSSRAKVVLRLSVHGAIGVIVGFSSANGSVPRSSGSAGLAPFSCVTCLCFVSCCCYWLSSYLVLLVVLFLLLVLALAYALSLGMWYGRWALRLSRHGFWSCMLVRFLLWGFGACGLSCLWLLVPLVCLPSFLQSHPT